MYKIILFLLLSFNLYAIEQIKENYYIENNKINSSIFFKDQNNILLYEIPEHKHSVKFKKFQLQRLLKEKGFKDFNINSRYVNFEVKSPIDTSKIESFLIEYYKKKYENINIKKVIVKPRAYMDKLPKSYTVDIRGRNHLSKDGIISIEDNFHKKYFFDYLIEAELDVVTTKEKILRDVELSRLNCKIKTVKLDNFRALPLQIIPVSEYQAKYHLKPNKIITLKDIEKLALVKKDTTVTVWLNNSGISISFAAKALQTGKLNDIITIQKGNGKKLKAKVVAKQKVEIR